MEELAAHWDRVHGDGGPHSWDQDAPSVSLRLLDAAGVGPHAAVVDVGGGDGALTAALLRRGFGDLTPGDRAGYGTALRAGTAPGASGVERGSWTPRARSTAHHAA